LGFWPGVDPKAFVILSGAQRQSKDALPAAQLRD
jgi:hypothetical protein